MDSPDDAFQKLVLEAVRACGPDLHAIERYVWDQMQGLEPFERERIHRDIRRLLSFRAPPVRTNSRH